MSALNMIVQGQQAHLLTDRAVYDRQGIVRGIGHKVGRLESLPLAVSGVGVCEVGQIARHMDALCPASREPEAWVAALPAVVRALREENFAAWPELRDSPDGEITLAAIYYSRALKRARGVIITSGDPSLPAYEPVALTCIAIPGLGTSASAAFDPRRPDFDPERDGCDLMEAQRRQVWADGHTNVGGGVDLTTVGPAGLQVRTLATWPDKIGSTLDGAAALCRAPAASRMQAPSA